MSSNTSTSNPINWTAEQYVRNNRQRETHDHRLHRIDPAKHDNLVNYVQQERNNENLTNILPRVKSKRVPLLRLGQCGPEISWPVRSSVLQPSADCDDTSHSRLEYEPKMKRAIRPANQLVNYVSE